MKRLAVFLDGTWNTLNNNTNVWRLKSLCVQNEEAQLVYYSQGVGTRFGEKVRGGVAGFGIDNEIIDAYTWLVQNYEGGDEVFIFGFSRGAYTARSLSGLFTKCGLLSLGAPLSIEQLYARYRRRTDKTIRALLEAALPKECSLEEEWLVRYSRPIPIKFIGVWDSVGSLGLPWSSLRRNVARYRFLDTHLYLSNEFAFHALALDEHRKNFEPTFWTKTVRKGAADPPSRSLEKVEQRWFIGAHANVGGGYPSDVLAQAPLKWLMDKAAAAGLRFKVDLVLDRSHSLPPIADSYKDFADGFYRLLARPFYRLIGSPPDVGTQATTSRINETIDASVFDRWRADASYRPQNLVSWANCVGVDPAEIRYSVSASDPAVRV